MTGPDTGDPLLLGIDMGSSRTKALLLDKAGSEVGWAAIATPFVRKADRTEATVDALLDSLARLLDGLDADDRRVVAAVGIAGMAESGAPLDSHGRPLAPVIAWHDRRGEETAKRLDDLFGADLSRRIGQRIRYIATAAKLGWLVDDGLRGFRTWLGVPELVLHALTGAEATEHSLAARTACLDVTTTQWLPDVARAAGFAVGVFPEILRAGEAMGDVTTQGAAWSALPAAIPVTLAGHDHLAGFVGSGARPNDLANSVGTAETVVGRSATLPHIESAIDRGAAVTLFPGEGWAVLASAARAGLAVDIAAAALGATPSALDEAATADGQLLDAPGLLDNLRRRDPPQLPEGEPGSVWATLLDALATVTGEAIDAVTHVTGPRDRLVVFGGGSTSRPWLEAKSRHATGSIALPVWRSTTAHAVARGAALQAGVAAGWWPSTNDAPVVSVEPVTGRVSRGVKWGSDAPRVVTRPAPAEQP